VARLNFETTDKGLPSNAMKAFKMSCGLESPHTGVILIPSMDIAFLFKIKAN
jgi:hypothetical protein